MYFDEVVFSGFAIVTLTMMFFGGFVWAIKKDIQKHGTGQEKSTQ